MPNASPGKTMTMQAALWKPGTSRWAWLHTSIYTIALAVGLPVTILLNTGSGWLTFSLIMTGGICNVSLAWLLRRDTRRAKTSATTITPHQ
jgi:hypothetical protein